jgi:hypothetical protein
MWVKISLVPCFVKFWPNVALCFDLWMCVLGVVLGEV